MSSIDGIELVSSRHLVPPSSSSQQLSPKIARSSVSDPDFEAEGANDISEDIKSSSNDDSVSSPRDSRFVALAKSRLKRDLSGSSRNYIKVSEDRGPFNSIPPVARLSAIRHLAIVHLPPIGVTLAILSLYIAKVRWNHPTAEGLNALQFAAKVHEALIIVSLGSALMHRINYSLLTKNNALPLGFLSSAFHLGAPFSYLTSSELWTPILYTTDKRKSQRVTGAVIILIAILCISASPLSAITMIPRQGWWKNQIHITDLSNVTYTSGSVYITDLDAGAVPNHNTSTQRRSGLIQNALLENTISEMQYTAWEGNYPFTNVTFTNYEAPDRPVSYRVIERVTVATCPLSPIANNLANIRAMWNKPSEDWLIKAEDKAADSSILRKLKQPLVAVQCSKAQLNKDSASFEFHANMAINESLPIHFKQYPALINLTNVAGNSGGPLGYSSLHLKDSMSLPISTDIMFVSVANETYDEENLVQLKPPAIDLGLCLISACWTEADTWAEFSRSNNALSHLSFPRGQALVRVANSFGTSDFIKMHEDWMTGIASLPNTSSNRSSYEEMMHFCGTNLGYDTFCLQNFLAMHLVDALAELGNFHDQLGERKPTLDTEKDGMVIFTPYIYTYAYEFGSSRGIPIAFCVLLLHVVIVLVHVTIVFKSGHLWYDLGWESFGDLLMLALFSVAPASSGMSGVTSSQTWIKSAVIREVGDEGRMGIFLEHGEEDMRRPEQ